MIMMKFGGTSVEDARAMSNVMEIVQRERHRKPVVVLSAIAGATNALLRSAHIALEGDLAKSHAELNDLLERHVSLLENLIDNRSDVQQLILTIRKRFDELKMFIIFWYEGTNAVHNIQDFFTLKVDRSALSFYFVFVVTHYFPIQNLLKIESKISSLVTSPVICAR